MSQKNFRQTFLNLSELNKQITEAKADIKVLTSAERKIKDSIKRLMVTQGIDTINLRQGKSLLVRRHEREL